ncbi:MAG: hypothetical protein V1870_02655 [Candidatus Aenigmatarchaeota archaeon]
MNDSKLWVEMLDVLKDIGSYLEKQDSVQERAKVQTPPKTAEDQKPIKGGDMSGGFAPGKGIAKSISAGDETQENPDQELNAKGPTLLKEEDDENLEDLEDTDKEESPDEEEDSDEDEDEDESGNDIDELKSLLKDIKSALMKNNSNLSKEVITDLKKSMKPIVQEEASKLLRKMGFTPTRPDVVKFGLDQYETTDIRKSADEKIEEANKVVDTMSKKSWAELGRLRESTGQLNPFSR